MGALPWLGIAFAIMMVLDRIGRHRKQKEPKPDGAANRGVGQGGNR